MEKFVIGLMRHPPVEVPSGFCYGHRDVPLKSGWEELVDKVPKQIGFHQIYSSPAQRCLILAETIAQELQISYQSDSRLIEFNFGDWEGKLWEEIPKQLIDQWAQDPWDWPVPGGETGRLLLSRVQEAWQEIKKQQRNTLIISHGGPLRLLRAIASNTSLELLGDLPGFGVLECFHFTKNKGKFVAD